MLELGFIPVRYVLMKKHLLFLHYILQESTETMIRKVYDTLKGDSRKGDFFSLIRSDKNQLNIDFSEEDISIISKRSEKKYLKEKVQNAALQYLVSENESKEKTKLIKFKKLKISDYLLHNENI